MPDLQRKKLQENGLPDLHGMVSARVGCDNRYIYGARSGASGGMTMSELKTCPFCGGDALLSHDNAGLGASYVRCKKCGLESIRFIKSYEIASDDRAVEYWNRRAGNDLALSNA